MQKFYNSVDRILGILMGLMVFFVFLNVVLRFVFNSGITWSEELSRYLFVAITYIGAIVAMRTNSHLGMDIVVRKLPDKLKVVAYILSQSIIIVLMFMLGHGAYKMVIQSTGAKAAATGIPLSVMYAFGILTAVFVLYYAIKNIFNAIKNPENITEMVTLVETEEDEQVEEEQLVTEEVEPVNVKALKSRV